MAHHTGLFLAVVATLAGHHTASAVFFKPNPIPDNYVKWTATVYSDGDGVATYSGATDEELVFWWETGTQDVWQMYDATTWKNCDFSFAQQLLEPLSSGGDYTEATLPLNTLKPGTYYLAAGVGAHCDAGQKLVLTLTENPYCNKATGWNSYVGGGSANEATGDWSTVGGGYNNRATGQSSVVLGGISNSCVSNYATVAGGYKNFATSRFATILGGARNTARGRFSLAAGYYARTAADYTAAFAFNGDAGCAVTTPNTVGFCAEKFYINDIDVLANFQQRQLGEADILEQAAVIADVRKSVEANEKRLDEILPVTELQQRAFATLDRIEAKLLALGVDASSSVVA